MKRNNRIFIISLLVLILSLVSLLSVAAATPEEMYENGAVSDGNVTYGDTRDGRVSDVSEDKNILDGEELEKDLRDMMPRTGDGTVTDTVNEGADKGNGSAAVGIMIAIIVALAVVLIVFLVMPKRK